MTDLLTFHQHHGTWFAFLGVHIVGAATEAGKWMSALDGNITWRRSAGDLQAAQAALHAHVREWYDAAHQNLAPGQAERLCEYPRTLRPKRELKIETIEPEAIALRIKRDGVVTTYVMPPVVDGIEAPPETILSMRGYCISAAATAEAKARAAPGDRMLEHELGVFTGLVRLIDALRSSVVIRDELRRIADARAEMERGAEPGMSGEADAKPDQEETESTQGENDQADGRLLASGEAKSCLSA